ncbi:hypothetical protein BsWGS_02495 [Bradybaena similaris]
MINFISTRTPLPSKPLISASQCLQHHIYQVSLCNANQLKNPQKSGISKSTLHQSLSVLDPCWCYRVHTMLQDSPLGTRLGHRFSPGYKVGSQVLPWVQGWVTGSPLGTRLGHRFSPGFKVGSQVLPVVQGWVTGSPLGTRLGHRFSPWYKVGSQVLPWVQGWVTGFPPGALLLI